jgi:hypothetical protein
MKLYIFRDNKINVDQFAKVKAELSSLYKTNAGVELEYVEEAYDFTTYPKEWYTPTDEGVKKTFLRDLCKQVHAKHAEDVDHVILLIHRDNWNLTGVWGWNISNQYYNYHVQQCRYDNRNTANSVGTLYHEIMHAHDRYILTYTGINISEVVKVTDWDDDVVHGGRYTNRNFGFAYIRYNENQSALKAIGTHLQVSRALRKELFSKRKRTLLEIAMLYAQLLIVKKRQQQLATLPDIAIRQTTCTRHT